MPLFRTISRSSLILLATLYFAAAPARADYAPTGYIVLQYDAGSGHVDDWQTVVANAQLPAGTSINYQTRSSSDGTTWSTWQKILTPNTVQSPNGQYLQIKAVLNSTSPTASPLLNDLTLTSFVVS